MKSVLLVTIDSLRVDHLGCYGYHRETTPNIDSLAEDGHLFENAFAHAGATRASFPSILTSSYPGMYGGFASISDRRTLISEVLDERGYQTAGFHSNPFLATDFGYARGFDDFFDGGSDSTVTATARKFVIQHFDRDGYLFRTLQRAFNATERHVGVEVGSAYVKADDLTDRAIEWLDSVDSSEPTFLWVHYMDVHHPYTPPEKHQLEFRESPVSRRQSIQLRQKMLQEPQAVTESELETLIDLYDAEIRFADTEIGRLIDHVSAQWDDDALLIVTADHGEEFREHGQFSHGTLHDEGIHVPLILGDGVGSGRHDELVGLADVAPTIADFSGGNVPAGYVGESLRPLLADGTWERTAVVGDWGDSAGNERRFFYRDSEWKYIWNEGQERLYDLTSDSDERHNVADANPEVIERVRDRLNRHRRQLESTREEVDDVDIDDDLRERLEQLGYYE